MSNVSDTTAMMMNNQAHTVFCSPNATTTSHWVLESRWRPGLPASYLTSTSGCPDTDPPCGRCVGQGARSPTKAARHDLHCQCFVLHASVTSHDLAHSTAWTPSYAGSRLQASAQSIVPFTSSITVSMTASMDPMSCPVVSRSLQRTKDGEGNHHQQHADSRATRRQRP